MPIPTCKTFPSGAPRDAVFALGIGGQFFAAIPSMDLAIARLASATCVGCQGLDALIRTWDTLLDGGVLDAALAKARKEATPEKAAEKAGPKKDSVERTVLL